MTQLAVRTHRGLTATIQCAVRVCRLLARRIERTQKGALTLEQAIITSILAAAAAGLGFVIVTAINHYSSNIH